MGSGLRKRLSKEETTEEVEGEEVPRREYDFTESGDPVDKSSVVN